MESLTTYFMLFLAGISALITYLVVPRIPVVALGSIAAMALIVGVWWHWNHFATEYQDSTWQESLRNWGSYVMVFAVIFLSYGAYAITAGSSEEVTPSRNSSNRNSSNRNSNRGNAAFNGMNTGANANANANVSILPTPNFTKKASNGNKEEILPNLDHGLEMSGASGEESKPVNGVNFLT